MLRMSIVAAYDNTLSQCVSIQINKGDLMSKVRNVHQEGVSTITYCFEGMYELLNLPAQTTVGSLLPNLSKDLLKFYFLKFDFFED